MPWKKGGQQECGSRLGSREQNKGAGGGESFLCSEDGKNALLWRSGKASSAENGI
jgi:hypothetical protein